MLYKTIIQGRLEFATEKTYAKVLKMFEYRAETYHKNDILFEMEEIFFPENFQLIIPRMVKQVYEKTYKNTAKLLEYCSQFAVSGSLNTWLIDEGKILHYAKMEPASDKVAVQQYLKGKSLVKTKGKEAEAIQALTKAIEKFDRHAQAYERRAKVNYTMKKYHDAKRDYDKSLNHDDTNPHAFYGRAKIKLHEKDYKSAIQDFDMTLKYSVALQEIYWKARRLKSICHMELGEYEKAAFDLKLITNRAFKEDTTMIHWKRWCYFNYGLVLMQLENYDEALNAFESTLSIHEGYDDISEAEKLKNRGLAKQKAGKNGYIKDIKDAADLGDKEAATLLKNIA